MIEISFAHQIQVSKDVLVLLPPPLNLIFMENQPNKLNIEFVDHMGYYIPITDVKGFDPEKMACLAHLLMRTAYAGMKLVKNLVIAGLRLKRRNVRVIKNQLIKLNFPSINLIL